MSINKIKWKKPLWMNRKESRKEVINERKKNITKNVCDDRIKKEGSRIKMNDNLVI